MKWIGQTFKNLLGALIPKRRDSFEEEGRVFAQLMQNSGDIVSITDTNQRIRFMNKAGRELVGLDQDAPLENLDRLQFYPPEYVETLVTQIVPQVIKDGTWTGEFAHLNIRTGEVIPVMMSLFDLIDPKTGKSRGRALVSRDLRASRIFEKHLNGFFDTSLDMIGMANTEGYFIKLNPAFTEVLGFTEEELCSRPCTDFIHPDDIEKTLEQILEQRQGRSVFSFENRYRTKDGSYRLLSWKSSPSEDGTTYGVARDITDERARQEKIALLREEAVAASKAKSEFLATMSHEIRTPINGVVGMTSLLLDTSLSEEQLDFAKNIRSSAEALLSVVNDILDFSKVEAGKIDLEKVDFDLVSMIDETAKSISFLLKNKSIPLLVNVTPEARRHFNGDPGRIRQILTNLLSNAAKFTEHGTVKLDARVDYSTERLSVLRFSVTDTGIGLTAVQASKIFQGFSQADGSNARKFGGTGLGLSISKRLVELMKGRIEVDSVPGVGSTFWFTIPLEHSTLAAAENRAQEQVIETKYPAAQLLVAEDNFVNQKIILAMLAKLGFAAQAVANGQEVLSALKERHFDLILMDCQMPEMDGYEATKRIRSAFEKAYSDIPIIALTANALKGDRELCLAVGMDDYASKPVKISDLSIIIEKWLDTAAAKRRSA